MLLPQYLVGLIKSGKDSFDIQLYDHDFYPNTKAFHVAEIFIIFIRHTFMFITYHFRIFTYVVLFFFLISVRSFVCHIVKFILTFPLPLKVYKQICE